MLAFPNVFHFFAHKFARLSGRRLAFAFVFARAFNCFFFWHNKMVSPLATRLDVKKITVGAPERESPLPFNSVCGCHAALRGSLAKKFDVTPGGKRRVVSIPDFKGRKRLTFAALFDF
jgi:hypothetical protein